MRPLVPPRARSALYALLLALAACQPKASAPPWASASAAGEWVVINYWATWCKPCRKEIPELNALDAEDGVTVFGVNFDGVTGEALAAESDALGIRFHALDEDPASVLGLARPEVLPTTLILAPDGALRQVLVGPQTLDTLHAAMARPVDRGAADAPASP